MWKLDMGGQDGKGAALWACARREKGARGMRATQELSEKKASIHSVHAVVKLRCNALDKLLELARSDRGTIQPK